MTTHAELLGIHTGLVWIIGHTDEENALLDPLPDDVETITERAQDWEHGDGEHEDVTAAVVVLDDVDTIATDLDDALPQVGSVPLVWVAAPRDVDIESVVSAVTDYGWNPSRRESLDTGWTAIRVDPA